MQQYYKISESSLAAIADAIRALILVSWSMTPAQMAAQLSSIQILHSTEAVNTITTMARPTSTATVEIIEN